ncbi:MAG TPA: DUF3052 family protein [Steroidobacteraceae bacterium]|nr:DUF3052 family protein [Steroidobacteraceae bacterium]
MASERRKLARPAARAHAARARAASGYSSTPLAKKLGIGPGARLFVQRAPDHYLDLLAPLPAGVRTVTRLDADTDVAHLFTTRRAVLAKTLLDMRAHMRDDALLWVSWPKKTAGVASDITEDVIRELALPLGLVDVKVCAVDENWSGLKLVLRLTERAAAARRPRTRAAPRRPPA